MDVDVIKYMVVSGLLISTVTIDSDTIGDIF